MFTSDRFMCRKKRIIAVQASVIWYYYTSDLLQCILQSFSLLRVFLCCFRMLNLFLWICLPFAATTVKKLIILFLWHCNSIMLSWNAHRRRKHTHTAGNNSCINGYILGKNFSARISFILCWMLDNLPFSRIRQCVREEEQVKAMCISIFWIFLQKCTKKFR